MEENLFLKHLENNTRTENGAIAFESTLSYIVDQFGLAGNYCHRSIGEVFSDMEKIWEENPTIALRFVFYLRAITRKIKVNGNYVTSSVVKGQGAKDESFKRLLWVAKYHPESFYKNISILPFIGSWKDIWQIMYFDIIFDVNAIDHNVMFDLLKTFLENDVSRDLIKKYMPRIRSSRKCKTDWARISNRLAKECAKYFGLSYSEYNRLKSSGTAHDFQKIICSRQYSDIKWKEIPGKALSLLANGKFIEKHDLSEDFTKWIVSTDHVKFTGYVYELFKKVDGYISWRNGFVGPSYKKAVFDKQFDNLIEKASEGGEIKENVWCALDTSGSMLHTLQNSNVSAFDVCVSLGIFFSTLNKGSFHKHVVMFSSTSSVKRLEGNFTDMVQQIRQEDTAWGGTNFISAIEEIVRVRRNHPEIPLEDYPKTLLVISDMQFNPTDDDTESNYQAMKRMLYEVFPQDFVDSMKFIWWNCISRVKNFPATVKDGGCYFLSGFDGSVINLLLGGEIIDNKTGEKRNQTMEEMIEKALNQEVIEMVEA